jgi:malate dehydrogenase
MVPVLRPSPWPMLASGKLTLRPPSPSLSSAANKPTPHSFAEKVIRASKGETGIVEPTFVYLPGVEGGEEIKKIVGSDFFSVPVELGPEGAKKAINVVGSANDYEKKLLKACYTGLNGNITKGIEFIKSPPA